MIQPGPFTPDPLGSTWPAPFPWLSFGFSGPVPGFSLKRIGFPSPLVTVDMAKTYCRVYHSNEDILFGMWTAAAQRLIEMEAGTALTAQQWEARYPSWPTDGQVRLGLGPVQSVDLVQYYAPAPLPSEGTLTTLTEGVDYQTWLDYRPPFIVPFPGKYWPVVQFGKVPAVVVQFTAGYESGASFAPEFVTTAIYMLINYWYTNRGDEDAPEKLGMPAGIRRIIQNLTVTGYR